MSETETELSVLEQLIAAIEQQDQAEIASLLLDQQPADIADLLEAMPPARREPVWSLLADDLRGEVLAELHDEVRASLIGDMAPAELIAAAQEMDTDDLAEIFESVPEDTAADLLDSLDRQDRLRLEQSLSYPEDSAGRLMDPDIVTIRANATVDLVLRYLRRHDALPDNTDALMVVDKENVFLGVLSITRLLTAQPEQTVGELMQFDADSVTVTMSPAEIASLFERHDLVSVAVIDDDKKLLGRITIDDVVDIIQEQAEQRLLNMAGLDQEDDLFAPVLPSARRRAFWLGINLLTALLAAWVIGQFSATLEQIVALAVLMPIVASMGGIAGSQTLTLAIRGLALGQISRGNVRTLAIKEMAVGAINGVGWSLVVALIAVGWFGDWRIGGIIAVAMLINLIAAAMAGIAVPLALDRLKLDPALSGSVILTTVTDVVGFLSFLGLATLLLL